MRQTGILAAAGIYALDHMINRLEDDHKNAMILSQELCKLPGIVLDINKVSTNLIFFYLDNHKLSDELFIAKLAEHNIKIDTKGNHQFRIATHFGFFNNDIERVIKSFKLILRN